jgi:hypothetical protein
MICCRYSQCINLRSRNIKICCKGTDNSLKFISVHTARYEIKRKCLLNFSFCTLRRLMGEQNNDALRNRRPHCLKGKSPRYPLSGRLRALHSLSGRHEEEREFLPLLGTENLFLSLPARGTVIIPSELTKLLKRIRTFSLFSHMEDFSFFLSQ